jgi:hypothetical protein
MHLVNTPGNTWLVFVFVLVCTYYTIWGVCFFCVFYCYYAFVGLLFIYTNLFLFYVWVYLYKKPSILLMNNHPKNNERAKAPKSLPILRMDYFMSKI